MTEKNEETPDPHYSWRVIGSIIILVLFALTIIFVSVYSYALTATIILLLFSLLFALCIAVLLLIIRKPTNSKHKLSMDNPFVALFIALVSGFLMLIVGLWLPTILKK
jgi:hypothetical protein